MEYVAMRWDHRMHAELVQWVVIECSAVEVQKNGALQALPPRKDVAYFVDPETAEELSKLFADLKNGRLAAPSTAASDDPFKAYPWDHKAGNGLINWAVLRWDENHPLGRRDIAYFLWPETAEADATSFQSLVNLTPAAHAQAG